MRRSAVIQQVSAAVLAGACGVTSLQAQQPPNRPDIHDGRAPAAERPAAEKPALGQQAADGTVVDATAVSAAETGSPGSDRNAAMQASLEAAARRAVDTVDYLRHVGLGELPMLAPRPMDRVLTARIENGRIVVTPEINDLDQPHTIIINNWPGTAKISSTVAPDQSGRHFTLVHVRMTAPTTQPAASAQPGQSATPTDPAGPPGSPSPEPPSSEVSSGALGVEMTSLLATDGRVTLARDLEQDDTLRSVQYIQTSVVESDTDEQAEQSAITLYVRDINSATAQSAADVRIEAASLPALRRAHPELTSVYLDPILLAVSRDGALLAPDPRVARQVLRTASPGPLPDAVASILKRLDSDSFKQRMEAAAELQAMGDDAAAALSGIDFGSLSVEQRIAVEAFLKPYRPLSLDEVRVIENDAHFLIDALLLPDAALRAEAARRLGVAHRIDATPVLQAPAAQRPALVEALRRDLALRR